MLKLKIGCRLQTHKHTGYSYCWGRREAKEALLFYPIHFWSKFQNNVSLNNNTRKEKWHFTKISSGWWKVVSFRGEHAMFFGGGLENHVGGQHYYYHHYHQYREQLQALLGWSWISMSSNDVYNTWTKNVLLSCTEEQNALIGLLSKLHKRKVFQ